MEARDRTRILIKTARGSVCVCGCLHVCGYTRGCMHVCVGMNVSRYESTAQKRGTLVEKQVNDRQRLDKDKGMYKQKGTAGKVGVELGCRWCWMDTSGLKYLDSA